MTPPWLSTGWYNSLDVAPARSDKVSHRWLRQVLGKEIVVQRCLRAAAVAPHSRIHGADEGDGSDRDDFERPDHEQSDHDGAKHVHRNLRDDARPGTRGVS